MFIKVALLWLGNIMINTNGKTRTTACHLLYVLGKYDGFITWKDFRITGILWGVVVDYFHKNRVLQNWCNINLRRINVYLTSPPREKYNKIRTEYIIHGMYWIQSTVYLGNNYHLYQYKNPSRNFLLNIWLIGVSYQHNCMLKFCYLMIFHNIASSGLASQLSASQRCLKENIA